MGATFFNLSGLLLKGRWRVYSREQEPESRKEWRGTPGAKRVLTSQAISITDRPL
jgi:hypothetical protein